MAIDKKVFQNKKEIFLTAYKSLEDAVKIDYSDKIISENYNRMLNITQKLFTNMEA